MQADAKQIEQDLVGLNEYNATPGQGLTRLTFTPEHAGAKAFLTKRMEAAGLTVREDAMGNLIGRREGSAAGAPAIALGSHYDSVRGGGMFDGPAGISAGLEVARMLQQAGKTLAHPLEVYAIVEEEGSRFNSGMLGGRAIAGLADPASIDTYQDSDGVTYRQAAQKYGIAQPDLASVKRTPADMLAFLELHIEQGPVLETAQLPVGIVNAIVGISAKQFTIFGRPDHAGTTPMEQRKDALVAAAKVITAINKAAKSLTDKTVSTVGFLQVVPGSINVVPAQVTFTVEIRSGSEDSITWMEQQTLDALREAVREENLEYTEKRNFETKPVRMAPQIVSLLKQAAADRGIATTDMQSGAGHDSMFIAQAIHTGMLFVPSKDGRSHCPEEWTEFADIARGTELLYDTVLGLDNA